MKKINILESLKKIDKDTFSEYDLSTLYESNRWDEDQKKQLVKYISSCKDPSFIGQYMADCQDCKNITESDDDDIDDLRFIDMSKEAYLHGGDDYGFDEYDIIDHYDDLEDGYDDEELASGFGGDRNKCPKCGSSNYHDGHCYACEPDYVPNEIDEAFDKEGGPFWYFTKHGVQPGSVPKGIQILDIIECADGSGSYFKSDKVLTTKELNDFEIVEKKPEGLKEASYGGAYDIADDQYFTKDELVEFGEDVVDNLNELGSGKVELQSIYIDNNVIDITVEWDGNEVSAQQPVDMRRIRTSKDLMKYRVRVISKMKPELEKLGFDFGPHLGDYELSESFDTELRDKLVRMWFEENTADWLVKNDPATAEWLAYGGATTNDFAEVEEEVLAKLNAEEGPKEAKWERLITKPVNDSDGFTTDYSMWYNNGEKRWVFIFGDSDAYDPTNTDPDWETEDPEEARQWFLDYKGFEDTDESLKEDWRTGTFTKDDLPGYRAEMKKRVESVVYSIRAMKRNHPDMADLFDKLTDELVDSLTFLKDESLNEDTEEDELETADQKISSAATSINSSKLPAIFRMVKFQPDTMNLDYGGGRFDNAAEELSKINVTNLVYDPYNRSSEHNQEVLKQVRSNGGADTVTISNVLNVIAEPEARQTVLRNAKKLVKPGGKIYITVYEGNKSGSGAETKAGYQLNKDTKDYVDEISQVFDNVTRKGKLIIAE